MKRAALTRLGGVAHEQPEVGLAARLDAAGDAGGAEAGRQPGVRAEVAHVRGRGHPARAKERLGGGTLLGAALTAAPRSRAARTSG